MIHESIIFWKKNFTEEAMLESHTVLTFLLIESSNGN